MTKYWASDLAKQTGTEDSFYAAKLPSDSPAARSPEQQESERSSLAPEGSTDRSSTATADRARLQLTPYAIPIFVLHLGALLMFVPWFFSLWGVASLVIGAFLFGQGINLGYHRLLSHRSLKVPAWLERCYVMVALCCMEETPAKWVSTHRLHHVHSDEHPDPHSPRAGFLWSHFGWLIIQRPKANQLEIHEKYAADILRTPFYRYLESAWWFAPVLLLTQILCYFLAGWALALADPQTSGWQLGLSLVVWGVIGRIVVVWHLTWSVNSLTHVFGYRNYATGEDSRNNWLIALLASGEGWHNNHHHDPASASVQHRWWEIDLTYYQILLLERLGLAKEVVRPRHVRRAVRRGKSPS